MEKAFVLEYLSDPTDDTSSSDVLGVYKTKEEAQKVMKKEFDTLFEYLEISDEDISDYNAKLYEDDTQSSICHYGSYYCWTIYEFEI